MAKILIVDDEPAILQLFQYIFEEAGHEVLLAGDGRQALDSLLSGLPDFMVLDVAMPEMSGKELVLELKRLGAKDPRLTKIPFVVMTGENFMDGELNMVFGGAPGFVCFFPKMTPPEKILEKAEETLRSRQ